MGKQSTTEPPPTTGWADGVLAAEAMGAANRPSDSTVAVTAKNLLNLDISDPPRRIEATTSLQREFQCSPNGGSRTRQQKVKIADQVSQWDHRSGSDAEPVSANTAITSQFRSSAWTTLGSIATASASPVKWIARDVPAAASGPKFTVASQDATAAHFDEETIIIEP